MGYRADLKNMRFGRWKVLSFVTNNSYRQAIWKCKCSCGTIQDVVGSSLVQGHSNSCGCSKIDQTRERFTTHGHSIGRKTTREYQCWANMRSRCESPEKRSDSKYYYCRGITVCKRWHKFENFLADMGECPTNKHTLDRKNNDLGYFKSNCRWVTRKEQMRNTSFNLNLSWKGKTQSISQWAEDLGISYSALIQRIKKLGWPVEKAFTTPVQRQRGKNC